ncbi:hypothetical protein CAEBREN_02045 [Caenorhabditis brenneri]|uniref:Uncharacterized protein n=1 Tax=Caenorhabditis brenneri TaxID=135651 RepID=G0NEJ8_CAEBE|nr:hypothetical protein CAEBREN_02045 [Caenorhabditis brenneri]
MSFACQADVDSCNCPDILINNEGKYETAQRYLASDQCSLFMAYGKTDETDYSFFEPIVYSTERPISSGDVSGVVLFEDLICINEGNNDFNWYYFNKKLKNVTIGWNTVLKEYGSEDVCSCGAFPVVTNTDVLKQYDKNGLYKGAILGRNMFNASCNFKLVCDEGFDGVVFSDNEEPLMVENYDVSCVFNPMTDDLKIWLVNGMRVLNPVGACLRIAYPNPIPLPDCKCPPIKLMDQADIQENLGGSYLGNGMTWEPELGYSNEYSCYFNIFCPPVATSFLTILLRSNGNPIYINRVIDDQSTFVPQPREIGNFKCAQHTDGSYQWHFHDYPVTDVGFACQADVSSCSCPEIKVDGISGASVEERYPGAWNQCSLYSAECSGDGELPFLYSTDTTIDTGSVYGTVYDDLVCIKGDDDNEFNWYFSNKKLENVSIGCNSVQDEFNSPSVCECGAFPIIDDSTKLIKYDKTQKYTGAQIGINSWTPDCQFYMTCEAGFVGVVFSDNYDPIELTGNYITCTFNPLSNYLSIWVVNSVRLINPAGGCLKKL